MLDNIINGGDFMETVLKLCGVSKVYGNNKVVDSVSFEIEKGCVCGLLGPNGAGKTTIMKIIMNQIKCDGGFVSCEDGLKIKYLQDVPQFYEFYSVNEYLNFVLEISGYNGSKESRINEVIELLDLKEHKDKKIRALSRGLRQKLGIASVIVDEPDILILDEPVSALDPLGRKEMIDIISLLKGKVTIIFSSHILNDVERVCDRIILINKGKIILNSSIDSIGFDKKVVMVCFNNREDLLVIKDKLEYENNYSESIKDCLEISGDDLFKLQSDIFSLLIDNNIFVKSISVKVDSLEEIFLREVRKNG